MQEYKAMVSDAQKMVKFDFPLSDDMRAKLETQLSIHVESTVPMRWIQGDTPAHIDRADEQFSKTHLIYLTNSIGTFIVDGRSYPIVAGEAHVFNEGLEHYTVGAGNIPRLMIGPMSETGFGVGFGGILYYSNKTDAENQTNQIISSGYTMETYNAGVVLVGTGIYYVYPYIAPIAPIAPPRPLVWGSLFTNNSQVYYKSHSLSTGSGGSGVRNVRHKQRKT